MTMIHRNIKLVFFLSLVPLIFAASAFGETYFVDVAGYDSKGNGHQASPWKTVSYALKNVQYGDTISINDGSYSEGQLAVPAGVSLTSTSQDSALVILQPSASMDTNTPFVALHSSAGSVGNQTVSYISINGDYKARTGISVKSRDNVRIHHCTIKNFRGDWARGVFAGSGEIPLTANQVQFFPADTQPPGTDTALDALWPANPMQNFELDNNTIIDCGWKGHGDNVSPAIKPFHLKNSSIHHNTIDSTNSGGQPIHGCVALLWNVDIYNNTLTMANAYTDRSTYPIEIWGLRNGCEIYNNTSDFGFSITCGKETSVYNNAVIFDPVDNTSKPNMGLEFTEQSYGEVYGNFFSGVGVVGILAGCNGAGGKKDWIKEYVTIRNNVVRSTRGQAIAIYGKGSYWNKGTTITRHMNIYNNVVHGRVGGAHSGSIHLLQLNQTGDGVLTDINIQNNIVMGCERSYGAWTKGTVTNVVVDHNIFYDNLHDTAYRVSDTNTFTTDPNFKKTGLAYDGYTPQLPTDAIDGGVDVGLKYHGSAPDCGAIEVSSGAPSTLLPPQNLKSVTR